MRGADGATRPAAEALAEAGLTPVVLAEKEGLALINGTDGMLGMLALALADLEDLLRIADVTAAMSVEALLGTDRVFAADLRRCARIPGRRPRRPTCARLLAGSPIVASHRDDTTHRSRTPTRCAAPRRWPARRATRSPMPAGSPSGSSPSASTTRWSSPTAGSSPTATSTARRSAYVLDFLAIAVADVASISERRTDRLLDRSPQPGPAAVPRRTTRASTPAT